MLTSRTPAKIESVVHSKIRAVLEDRLGESPTIRGIDKLNATLGLSSLDLAVIVAELEIELGTDPFAKLVLIGRPCCPMRTPLSRIMSSPPRCNAPSDGAPARGASDRGAE